MGVPYVGEIRIFAGNFAPAGWEFCHGQLLSISENETLFQLIGTTYGGDGQNTFALPDLRGRIPVNQSTGHSGTTHTIGQQAGLEMVALTVNQMPSHSHYFPATNTEGNTSRPGPDVHLAKPITANRQAVNIYSKDAPGDINIGDTTQSGGGQPHENMPPFMPISFIIALFGSFPSQT